MSSDAALQTKTTTPRLRRRKGQRVLVVEDDPLLAMELEDALLAAGAGEVVVTSSMAEAAAMLEAWTPHAVVLDVRLDDRDDGWALAALISMLGPRRPRIVFSTGLPESVPAEARALGPVYGKPYDTAQLAAELLNRRKGSLMGRLRAALR